MIVTEQYFGFMAPLHRPGCTATGWEVRYRAVEDAARPGGEHACTNPRCTDHQSRYTPLRVQVLCRTCDRMLEFAGEETSLEDGPLAAKGYGTPPLKAGPVWLYAGAQILRGEPTVHGYLVAGRRTDHLVQADVLGEVRIYFTPRKAVRWEGRARPSWSRDGTVMMCEVTEQGFTTPAAAAKWVAAQSRTPES